MSTDIDNKRRIAAMCWKRGTEAMNQQNWDYAIEMFGQAVTLMPENVLYRQSLRGCECRKYGDNKTGARFAGTKLMTVKGRIKKARFQEDWTEMDKAGEEGLRVNPWDPQLNGAVGEACDKRGFTECAVFAYTAALEGEPENKDFLRALGTLLEQRGEYDKAASCWEKIYKLDPTDGHARSMMTQIQASKVMRRSWNDAESTRDAMNTGKAYDEADGKLDKNRAPGAADGPGMSEEADLLRQIKKNPSDVAAYTKLAQLYVAEKRLEDALAKYKEALQVSGGDPNIRELMEDTELDILRQNLTRAKEAAGRAGDDETARRNVAALNGELVNREIEILSARVERYPQNLQIKFELALRFMKVKKWPLAIKLLQQASADVRMRGDVLLNLGKCFLQDNKRTLAMKNLESAAPEINIHDRPKLYCEVHYLLGYVHEDAGNHERAIHHYTEVLQVDYDFRDARQRLERLQGSEGGAGIADEA